MAEVNPTISNLTLNASRLNNPIKGDCQVDKNKTRTYYILSTVDTIDSRMQIG